MVWIIYVYIDTLLGFYGYFFLTHLYCLVRRLCMVVWTHVVLVVLYACVFCIFVFAPVQRNWACFTWKGALELCSLLLFIIIIIIIITDGIIAKILKRAGDVVTGLVRDRFKDVIRKGCYPDPWSDTITVPIF